MSEHDDKANKGDDAPPTIEFDTPDQPNSWVAEVARQRQQQQKEDEDHGRQPQH